MFKGDVAGRMVLGQGFRPNLQPAPDEAKLEEIVFESEKHLNAYQAKIAASYADLDGWRTVGHKAACQALTPVLQWFEKVSTRYPELSKDQRFAKNRLASLNRLGTLCNIDIGMETVAGKVEGKLGAGTFGTVWRVRDGHSNRAFKVYHAQDLSVPEKARRFRHGFDAMSQLDHPHIVKVRGFTEAPLGFVMDFIEGANLRDFTGTLEEPREILALLLTIGETLKHAHNRGVVHRDVKPENIIVSQGHDGKWRAYLTDFDLAWFSTASQFTKEGLGTWQYSAPEQLANPGSASARAPSTDSYSFGQLAYYAITGSDPVPMEVADNQSHLEKTIRDGWYADPAKAALEMYSACTNRRPETRPNFETICLTISKILQQLNDISESTVLAPDRFVRELAFSMVGGSIETRELVSLSGKTQIRIEIKNQRGSVVDINLDFQALVEPVIDRMANYEQTRRVLNERIDRSLAPLNATRHRGTTGPFSAVIHREGIELTLAGLQEARLLVSRVIDAIESA
ncbi:MAG TPA: serine/threonine-protein kinase [Bryobacteraceae bacterium]|nr:serine/threonine-protein kinase [Bryobacteraceae bacterium]